MTHFHNVSLLGGPGVLSYGAGLKLYTIHEYWLLCPMHVLFRNNREPCEVKQCIRCSLHFHRPPQLWRYTNLIHQALQRIDAFLAPTEFTRALHLASGLPMYIETLPNFHDAWEPAPEDIPPAGRPFFLYVGRLEKLKGIHTLLPAFRSYPGADLLIAGEGSEAASLHQAARGISNIVFLGKVGREHLAHYYRSAIAVLVPSLGMEVFPLVILEALAAHTPLIARARGPLQEIVESSGCGLLFRKDSELPGLLARMQNQPAERARMGEAGYTKWCAEWTSEAHLTRYLALIERLRAAKASGLRH